MYRIMLADDEPSVLKGLTELLDWSAYDAEIVASASGGEEALSLLRIVPVQILITDICMPEMDGLTLIAEARALHPSLRCIVVSAHDEFDYVRRALTLGVENYLLKPINSGELAETLAKTVANIEREASEKPSEALAFRTNILDRWANSSIQDFELAERAALLDISLGEREYQAVVASPRAACAIGDRLARSLGLLEPLRAALPGALAADVFVDRYANLAVIAHADDLGKFREDIAAGLVRALTPEQCYASAGCIVRNAYSLGVSYRNAYSMLPYRYLDDGPVVFCDDHPAALGASTAELQFDQALEDLDGAAAFDAVSGLLRRAQGRPGTEALRLMLPLELKLLARFDDSRSRNRAIPDALLRELRALPAKSDAQLAEAISTVLAEASKALADMRDTTHPVVRRALDMVAASYQTNIGIKVIADRLNINPSYFGQLFKAETGQLFTDYLTAVRLRSARNLLAETDLRIGEIIGRIGISQQSYFNRIFKKEYGVTPVEYRRAVKGNAE